MTHRYINRIKLNANYVSNLPKGGETIMIHRFMGYINELQLDFCKIEMALDRKKPPAPPSSPPHPHPHHKLLCQTKEEDDDIQQATSLLPVSKVYIHRDVNRLSHLGSTGLPYRESDSFTQQVQTAPWIKVSP